MRAIRLADHCGTRAGHTIVDIDPESPDAFQMLADTVSRFPVKVRVVRTANARAKVLALRARVEAGTQLPRAAETLGDDCDLQVNATLLIAESVIDGEALGSLRILSGERGSLLVERRLELPAGLKCQSLAEASRLVVANGPHARLVRLMLWKAFHRYCLAAQIDTMLVVAGEDDESEYEWLGFENALPGRSGFSSLAGGEPTHRLMRLGVLELHERMSRNGHPLHDFFFVERHPEIDLLSAVAGERDPAPRRGRTPRLPDHARIAAELEQVAIV